MTVTIPSASLEGKVALVTGAGRGIGKGVALELARRGASVVVNYANSKSSADEVCAAIEALDTGARAISIQADVSQVSEIHHLFKEARKHFGHIDIVVANAGIATTMAKTWELSDGDWHDVIDVNLTGVWRTVKATVPAMIAAERGGCVVLTSSLAGLKGYSNIVGYVAAKHGVNGVMRTLANELGPYNIRVNTVCPGLIHTDMMMNQPTYDVFRPEIENPTKDDATEVFRTMQVLPTDWLEPRDVSEVIAWLASDAARFITGVAMPVDAGQIGRG